MISEEQALIVFIFSLIFVNAKDAQRKGYYELRYL